MPELPEVEQFRKTLLPLVSQDHPLKVSLVSGTPPKVWLSEADIDAINEANIHCTDVVRKGKLLCMILKDPKDRKQQQQHKYLYLHMGMTGSIRSPLKAVFWGHEGPMKSNPAVDNGEKQKEEEPFPPQYAYLTLQAGDYRVAFCDPRKFGKCELSDSLESFDDLAPDALLDCSSSKDTTEIIAKIEGKSLGIKGLLLDQKRAVSGVGNWVADEVLYQTAIHPDQSYLTQDQSTTIITSLYDICKCAVECLDKGKPYPSDWLFPYRWTKKKAGRDSKGRALFFLKSGGRTSAIVQSLQKLRKSQKPAKQVTKKEKGVENSEAVKKPTPKSQRKRKATELDKQPSRVKKVPIATKRRTEKERVVSENISGRRRSPRFS